MHLCLPPTANISVQVLHDDLFDLFFREILPQSLEGLPGIAWTTSLQYGDAQSIARDFSGINPAEGGHSKCNGSLIAISLPVGLPAAGRVGCVGALSTTSIARPFAALHQRLQRPQQRVEPNL